ncbi:glycosyltransferase [Psychroflexus aestuariivivens]|uniref:glycosyltransferase n=1 Tax=Psychroflexus aestuariivivens TaxID=1795040 RepID=UPI000FD74EF0|nr:glycosyltransferase [Psychroflexus aestuariivivens]
MKHLHFSFIVPVYNRPKEIEELLESLTKIEDDFEVLIIEDGSTETSEHVIEEYKTKLKLKYFSKSNSGPGDSRNFGMKKAKGNYYIILDSDVILPNTYLSEVREALHAYHFDCFGGPDRAHQNFSDTQKAIDYVMTSFLTTGGIRGSKNSKISTTYEPRSFNMGLSKEAFQETQGFSDIHPGEDPDLSIRLKQKGFNVGYIPKAFVYHKRRIDFSKFKTQVNKFGLVRPILLKRYPNTAKITYWFPSVYVVVLVLSLFFIVFDYHFIAYFLSLYLFLLLIDASVTHKSLKIGLLTLWATQIQFFGYGLGFLNSYFKIHILNKNPREVFPKLFFQK